MATQNINLRAQIITTSLTQVITATYNSGGVAISYAQPSSGLSIGNNGNSTMQYRIDNGDWIVLDKREANSLPVDLSINRVMVKLINDGEASGVLDLLVESLPLFYIGPNGEKFPVVDPPARVTGYRYSGSIATAVPSTGYTFTSGQWYRDGSSIGGQTAVTYTRTDVDIGTVLTFIPTGIPFSASGGVTLVTIFTPAIPANIGGNFSIQFAANGNAIFA